MQEDANFSPWEDEGETVTLTSFQGVKNSFASERQTAHLVDSDTDNVSWLKHLLDWQMKS